MDAKERLRVALKAQTILANNLRSRGIDDTIVSETIQDVDYRKERYYKQEQKEGLYASDMKWLTPLFQEQMIALNGIRYQIFPFDYAEIERSGFDYLPLSDALKTKFPEGAVCLNIHIPTNASLANIDFDAVVTFFKTYFNEYDFQSFIIRSWLVYPGLQSLLSENSNIRTFMNYFITEAVSHTNKVQALERIYGSANPEIYHEKLKISSLEKKAWKNLNALGVAFSSRKI